MDALNAEPRLYVGSATSAGAGNTSIELRPPEGKIWNVLMAWAYHTAGGARAAAWYWIDPDTPAGSNISMSLAALAANTPFGIGAYAAGGSTGGELMIMPHLWVTRLSYATFVWTATAGGEVGGLKALVNEYSGIGKLG